jgi:hypothetical protein
MLAIGGDDGHKDRVVDGAAICGEVERGRKIRRGGKGKVKRQEGGE